MAGKTATRKPGKKKQSAKKRLAKTSKPRRGIETVEDDLTPDDREPIEVWPVDDENDGATEQAAEDETTTEETAATGAAAESIPEPASDETLAAKLDKMNAWRKRCEEAELAIRNAERQYLASKEETKELKKELDSAHSRLARIVREGTDPQLPLPLTDGDAPAAASDQEQIDRAAAAAASDESWRQVRIETLELPARIIAALADGNVDTLGQLADYTLPQHGNKRLTDIKGIGDKAVEQISDAADQFWQSWHALKSSDTTSNATTEDSAGDDGIDDDEPETDDDVIDASYEVTDEDS